MPEGVLELQRESQKSGQNEWDPLKQKICDCVVGRFLKYTTWNSCESGCPYCLNMAVKPEIKMLSEPGGK